MDFDLNTYRIGDWIDLETYFMQIKEDDTNEAAVLSFLDLLLGGKIPTTETEIIEAVKEYARQVIEIKETFTWIFNPPPMPSSIESEIKNRHLIEEFQKDYSGYIEIIYLLCNADLTKIEQIKEMTVQDFFFWGEYLYRKRYIENVR